MKNSFFLITPTQQKSAELLASYDKASIIQWVSELPTANPSLSTRLFFDYIEGFNKVEMPVQQRLDCLEILRKHFLFVVDYLPSRFTKSGFPKGRDEHLFFNLLVSIEKNFTIGYWIVVKELTRRDIGWFQGKNVALAMQRMMKGLNEIVVAHYMMFMSVPDWVWIDLHSLYKLSVKIKKESVKVPDETSRLNKTSTIEDCYKQILLLSLTDPSGLMQKEVRLVYDFIEKITQHVKIEKKVIDEQGMQCIILMDEDSAPYFSKTDDNDKESLLMYLDMLKLYKVLEQSVKFSSKTEARFSSMQVLKKTSEKLPYCLFEYILQSWQGSKLMGTSFFIDRLDRYIVVGLNATHALQGSPDLGESVNKELLAETFSDRELVCEFEKEGLLSIGSLVSFRKQEGNKNKRALGVVKKITMANKMGSIVFELTGLSFQSYAVTYTPLNSEPESEQYKALLYGTKTKTGEQSFIIMQSFTYKDGDILRMYMNSKNFPIILGSRHNIGLGYWQFECRQIEEKNLPKNN